MGLERQAQPKGSSTIEFIQAILKVKKCLDWEDAEKAMDYLGEG